MSNKGSDSRRPVAEGGRDSVPDGDNGSCGGGHSASARDLAGGGGSDSDAGPACGVGSHDGRTLDEGSEGVTTVGSGARSKIGSWRRVCRMLRQCSRNVTAAMLKTIYRIRTV